MGGLLRLGRGAEVAASLKLLANVLPSLSLGLSAVLAWSSLLSYCGLACPVFEGALVSKAVSAFLGVAGFLVWFSLLLLASIGSAEKTSALVAVVSLAFIASLLTASFFPLAVATMIVSLQWLRSGTRRLLSALFMGACAVEALTVAHLLSWAAGLPGLLAFVWPFHFSLYCYAAPFMPVLVALSLLSPLLHPLFRGSLNRSCSPPIRSRTALASSAVLCLLLWLVLYSSSLNPGVRLVGVDSRIRYYPHALVLLRDGLHAVLQVGYDRPLSYLILLGLARLLGPFEAVKALPLLSLLLYVVSCYIAVGELWGKRVAGLAALLAPLTYTSTAGLFGGLFNNWFSLSLTLLAAASLARWMRGGKPWWVAAYLLLLALSMAAHIYMGVVAFAIFTLTLLALLITGPGRSRAAGLLILQLAILTAGLNLADTLIGAVDHRRLPSRILRLLVDQWYRTFSRVRLFSEAWWDSFSFAVFYYAATAALDPTVWLLTAAAAALIGPRGLAGALMTAWLLFTSVTAFTAPRGYIYRVLFNFPYPLVEAAATALIMEALEERCGERTAFSWLLAFLLYRLAYTLNYVCGLAIGG